MSEYQNKAGEILRKGDRVSLTNEATDSHTCPKGRANNRFAYIDHIDGKTGAAFLNRDLRGTRYWNGDDLQRTEQFRYWFRHSRGQTHGVCQISTRQYCKTLDHVLMLVNEALRVTPGLRNEDIRVDIYDNDHSKGMMFVEWAVEAKPAGFE